MVPSVSRREFVAWSVGLGAAWVAGRGAKGEEVAWLPEIQRVPPNVPVLPRPLTPLLVDSAGQPITTQEQWQRRRAEIRAEWLAYLRPFSPSRPAPPPLDNVE